MVTSGRFVPSGLLVLPNENRPTFSLTVYIQADSPGKDKEANWLLAPKGPFVMFMHYYWPKQALQTMNGKLLP